MPAGEMTRRRFPQTRFTPMQRVNEDLIFELFFFSEVTIPTGNFSSFLLILTQILTLTLTQT